MRRFFLPLLTLATPAAASPPCAETILELRTLLGDPAFPLRWHETTMDDGKPLVLSIVDHGGKLHLSFVKTREGLWAEGAGAVCARDRRVEARFARGALNVGPAAHWAMRYSLEHGGDFILARLPDGRLKISTTGWSGVFAAHEAD